jgi:hypothetical protein
MKLLEGMTGETFSVTAQRLLAYGMSEGQAYALAKHVTLACDASDDIVEDAVLRVLVRAKERISGPAEIEYVTGQRQDTLRSAAGR